MAKTEKLGVPITYIGKKPRKEDNVTFSGLVWTQGQTHIVPLLVAEKLLAYPYIWKREDEATVSEKGVSIVLTEEDLKPEVEQEQFVDIELPNLQGMTKADLQAYALGEFNIQFGARETKESMINQIVSLTNSQAAGLPQG